MFAATAGGSSPGSGSGSDRGGVLRRGRGSFKEGEGNGLGRVVESPADVSNKEPEAKRSSVVWQDEAAGGSIAELQKKVASEPCLSLFAFANLVGPGSFPAPS